MQKISSSSSYDVLVIRQADGSFKCTPFPTVFSSAVLKSREKALATYEKEKNGKKLGELLCYVNDQLVDIPMMVDPKSGRIYFIKKYNRKTRMMSDSSDVSDDERSQRSARSSTSKEKLLLPKNIPKSEKIEELKNEQVPKNFWQFAWLFNRKKEDQQPPPPIIQEPVQEGTSLAKIKEQVYQGQQSSKEPLFHLSLCGNLLKKKEKQAKEEILKCFYEHRVQYHQFIKDPPSFINNNDLVVRIDDSIYTWQLGIAILTCRFAYGKQLSSSLIDDMIKNKFTKSKWLTYFSGSNVTKLDINYLQTQKNPLMNTTGNLPKIEKPQQQRTNYITKLRKSPDTEMIDKMKLHQGANKIKFLWDTGASPAQQEISFMIFLWEYNDKTIISDIDGTITKSDILGQILNNYIHEGVVKLYAEIEKKGYKIIYLTARAIGQYKQTRKFIDTVEEGGVKLPEGPIFMSPDGFVKSFQREVIDKTPDVLKSKILASLAEVFPNTSQKPIFAGFGNRQTDNIAYIRMGIPQQNIYCISQKSKDLITSYPQMLQKIEQAFPLYIKKKWQQIVQQNLSHTWKKSKESSQVDDELINERKLSEEQYSEGISPLRANQALDLEENQFTKSQQYQIHINPTKSKAKSLEGNYDSVEMQLQIKELENYMSRSGTSISIQDKKKV